MRKMRLFLMTGLMVLGLSITSFAGYDANAEYIARLQKSLVETQEEYDETSEEIEELEAELEDMKSYYEMVTELYEKEMAKSGVKDMNVVIRYQEADNKYTNLKNDLKATKTVNERCASKIESIKEQLSSATERAVAWTGTMSEEDESDEVGKLTHQFKLEKKNGNWYLYSAYRSWTDMMGGQWNYSSVVTDDLDIAFYDSNDICVDDSLNRAESMDTNIEYYWRVNSDLVANNKYYIEFNGIKFAVYAKDYEGSTGNSHSSDMHYGESDYVEDSEYINNIIVYSVNNLPSIEDNNGTWFRDENNRWRYTKSNGESAIQEYVKVNGRWYTMDVNGVMYENCWLVTPNGVKYYCDNSGAMVTGWKEINNNWYYFNEDTSLFVNGVTPDGYTVNNEGVWMR